MWNRLHQTVLGALLMLGTWALLPTSAQVTIANNAAEMAGKIVMLADGTTARTVTNSFTFDRDPSPPFAVSPNSAEVPNLKISASNLSSGNIPIARLTLGTTSTLTSVSTGTQNDWAPGISGNTLILWSGVSNLTVTGLSGGTTGQIVTIKNIGSQVAFFSHNAGGSLAANRLQNVATAVTTGIGVDGFISYIYSGTDWEQFDFEPGAGVNFTPVWSNTGTANTLGNGTLTGRYWQNGRRVNFHIILTWGSTTASGNGAWLFDWPLTLVAGGTIGSAGYLFDASTGNRYNLGLFPNSTVQMIPFSNAVNNLATTVPFTWATSDQLQIHGWFEVG